MRKILYLIISLSLLTSSCDFLSEKSESKSTKKESKTVKSDNKITVRKSYYEDGRTLKKEITVKNGKKNGPAKEYYVTGELRTLVNYKDSKKQGETIWYYKNGKPYRVTPYVNGKMDGIRKKYYENGKLQAEIPYKNGELQEGTKEYKKDGNLITHDVEILFDTKDLLKYSNKYIVQTKLSKSYRKVKYYHEVTNTEGKKVKIPLDTYKGLGQIEYIIPKGTFKMTIVKFYAEFKTSLGNPILIHESFNLAIENR